MISGLKKSISVNCLHRRSVPPIPSPSLYKQNVKIKICHAALCWGKDLSSDNCPLLPLPVTVDQIKLVKTSAEEERESLDKKDKLNPT